MSQASQRDSQAGSAYYDIDAILAEEQSVPCVVQHDIAKLGHFNPNGQQQGDLAAGTELGMPLWLVRTMLTAKGTLLKATCPKIFTDPYRQALEADSAVVNLFDWNPYYFDFGMEFVNMMAKSSKDADYTIDVANSLFEAFSERYRRLMDMSQNAVNEDTTALTRNLDMLERKLFTAGNGADKAFNAWRRRRHDLITTAVSVDAATRKRKRAA